MVDCEQLTDSYLESQKERIRSILTKMVERTDAVKNGRVVPDDGELNIGTGRYLNAAVMFIDISGFSGRPSEGPQEQTNNLNALTLVFTELIRIIRDYGGHVEKNTGDGLMAYFADSEDGHTDNGSKRAISAALTMFFVHLNYLNFILARWQIMPIFFRITIDHGAVTIAEIGSPRGYRSRTAIGTTANVASKLLKVAAANQIIIGDKAKQQLPLTWQIHFTRLLTADTGFTYRLTGLPYFCHEYTGRWNKQP